MVLGKTRFGGFFLPVEKALADVFRVAAAEGCVRLRSSRRNSLCGLSGTPCLHGYDCCAAERSLRQLLQERASRLEWSMAYTSAWVCPLFTLKRCVYSGSIS
jgi:hypothetical protein